MTESNCDRLLARIYELENEWKANLASKHGAGGNSEKNKTLIKLRNNYKLVCSNHSEQTKIDG